MNEQYGYFSNGRETFEATGFDTITAPSGLALSLAEAKDQCNLFQSETFADSVLYGYIRSATELCQSWSWTQFLKGTFETLQPGFAFKTRIWKNPVIAINSIKYYDSNNALQTLDPTLYNAVTVNRCMTIMFADTTALSIPPTYDRQDAVVINFDAGFAKNIGSTIAGTSCVLATGTVTKSAHGLFNGNIVTPTSLGTVTGISLDTNYYVVGRTVNTYQLSTTYAGTAIVFAGSNATPPTVQQISALPDAALQAMRLLVSQWYTNREAEVAGSSVSQFNLSVQRVLDPISVKVSV